MKRSLALIAVLLMWFLWTEPECEKHVMEQKLKSLFDYQKFAGNPRLDAMLAEAEGRCAALDDDALGLVSAAGTWVEDAEKAEFLPQYDYDFEFEEYIP